MELPLCFSGFSLSTWYMVYCCGVVSLNFSVLEGRRQHIKKTETLDSIYNLDSILKSRDITLPTKVRIVKAMVFPVVMYGCESWTIKKAEHKRIDPFELWC